MPNVAEPLIQYLRELEQRGQTHVSVDDEARKILRAFYLRAHQSPANQVDVGGSGAARSSGVGRETSSVSKTAGAQSRPGVNAAKEKASSGQEASSVTATGASAAQKIDSLMLQVATWPPVQALSDLRKTMVFSVGSPEADIMLVGESPGFDEERLQEPFVGKAGQKLDGILKAMGVERKNTYITNIVKFRPAMPNQTTNNRQPTSEELAAFMPFIQEEIKVVAPKVIIALGGTAAQALLASEESVVNMRGEFHDCDGVPLRVTYHPSYILHNEATSEKRKIWEDMLAVMDLLQMPVSEKQRDYFA